MNIQGGGLNRREALFSVLASLALSRCCNPAPGSVDQTVSRLFIDAHCHVFNAHDIPVAEFLINTALKEEAISEPWSTLAPIAARLAELWAATTDTELQLVQPGLRAEAAELTPADEKAQFQQLLEQALKDVRAAAHLQPGAQHVLDLVPLSSPARLAAEKSPERFVAQTAQGPASGNLEAASIIRLLTAFKIADKAKAGIEAQMATQPGQTIDLQTVVTDNDIHALSLALAAEADAQQTDYGAVLYVFEQITHTRMDNIQQMDSSLGVSAANPAIVRLYVPALVDYDCWYKPNSPSLAIELQAKIMAKLARMQSDPNRFVNGYVAFDPLRALLVEAGVLTGQAPFDTVKEAIGQLGYAGVKLYPPMGFAPTANSMDNSDFGPVANEWIPQLAAAPRNKNTGPYHLGPELDRVLDVLFEWCRDNHVPIMAHCGDSQASFARAGAHASPDNWYKLLTRTDKDFSKLQLNLAHFGSFWCHDEGPPVSSPDPYSEQERCFVAQQWTAKIVSMICETSGSGWRFPNLYFDIADMGDITATDGNALNALRTTLMGFNTDAQRGQIASRMLYGTDWFFLALAGKTHVYYINDIENLIKGIAPVESVFHANAARFLGLFKDGATDPRTNTTASRLYVFYGDNPQRRDTFATLFV